MMSILPRRVGETILIGDDIVVTVVRIRGGHVRVGIKAPRDVRVRRGEAATERSPDSTAKDSATVR